MSNKQVWQNIAAQRDKYASVVKTKRIRRWIIFVGMLLIAGYLVIGDYGFYKMGTLLWERRDLKKEFAIEAARKDSLENIKSLAVKDPAFMEKMAREKLGMVKQDEKVYKFMERPEKDSVK